MFVSQYIIPVNIFYKSNKYLVDKNFLNFVSESKVHEWNEYMECNEWSNFMSGKQAANLLASGMIWWMEWMLGMEWSKHGTKQEQGAAWRNYFCLAAQPAKRIYSSKRHATPELRHLKFILQIPFAPWISNWLSFLRAVC